ncbi:MAG: YafY family transcriptional regulator [Saprospiraceae bacterium]|nr:YafY family transcriptional regulator [Saprospiraceae bacterium]
MLRCSETSCRYLDISLFSHMLRLDRLQSILIQLQSGKIVRAKDIADRFGISLRTVYRDIQSLEESGVPIIGEAGVGYSLADGYRLPPVQFTQSEAAALMAGGKLAETLTDVKTAADYQSAMFKIKAVLRNSEKETMEYLSSRISVLPSPYLPEKKEKFLPLLMECIRDSKCAFMKYKAQYKEEENTRTVEPAGLFFMAGRWYMVAFCHLRNDYRHFRCDRIQELRATLQPHSINHPPIQGWMDNFSREEKDLTKVVIEMKTASVRFLGDQKFYSGFVEEISMGEITRLVFLTQSVNGFARWMMMFAGNIQVIEPQSLIDEMTDLAKNIINSHKSC